MSASSSEPDSARSWCECFGGAEADVAAKASGSKSSRDTHNVSDPVTLALISRFADEAAFALARTRIRINYGLNRVRFLTPVYCGQKIRGRFRFKKALARSACEILLTYEVTIEIEQEERPTLIAEWMILHVLDGSEKSFQVFY